MMLKKLLSNRKGTAEVIGSVMFIVILLFFFTNVYLWHDAATKEMNDLYVEKINSPITVEITSTSNPYLLTVANKGGGDATLSILWVDVDSTSDGTFDGFHGYYNLTALNSDNNLVLAGTSISVSWINSFTVNSDGDSYAPQPGDKVRLQLITTVGNPAACTYTYSGT